MQVQLEAVDNITKGEQVLKAVHKTQHGRREQDGGVEVNYCKHNTVCYYFTPQERSVRVICEQIGIALSGRHCILKQGHNSFITLSRSTHRTLTQPGPNTWGLRTTMPRQEGDRLLSVPKVTVHTLQGGVSASRLDFNREQDSEKCAWSGYMITLSSIRDNQHCEVKVAARFL